ncbi:hypothetical protein O181_057643 [Austropuccinia psidii MF-1]|uniref:Transcription initiation factor TFIID subunit 4 n=1 Tax=Austropuccinia psidii MF-1 TaxID=1389203 RepID=A0A9Q3HUQ0_9BASI|nr:hypothetical protein [Austropuccinia psidii MF-1]
MSANSPASKRSKLDSPLTQQIPLALPGSSWKLNHHNSITGGNKLGLAGLSNHNDIHSPSDEHRPSASGSGTNLTGKNWNSQTDFDTINDAVGISGVDIAAEEELSRQQSTTFARSGTRTHSGVNGPPPWLAPQHRVKIMDFLDKPALTVMVQHIAASYQLKTLEPAILDVLTQAAEARIHSLIIDSIAAKDHRLASSHLRPPPLYPTSPPKGKQKEKAPEAMYDQLIYDEPERILSILARVEGEEERRARLERQSTESEADRLAGITSKEIDQQPTTPSHVSESSRSHPTDQNDKIGSQAKKEKKRKREGPGQQAKNMSEDARARQSNQTAMRSVGGRSKYSWLSGGVVNTSTPRVMTSSNPTTAIMASLPAPKFAPSNTKVNPINNKSNSTTVNRNLTGLNLIKKDGTNNQSLNNRLGGLIPSHHLATGPKNQEERRVELKDCLFALERERGTGVGKGSGSKTLFKTYLIGRSK